MPSVCCSDLTFRWPDGTTVLDGLDLSLGPGRSGLVGSNGTGKSTLLRLVAGLAEPTRGAVQVDGTLAYRPQHLPLHGRSSVDEMLGIAGIRAALRDVEAGVVDEERLARIGDAWDVEERARATLDRLGLTTVTLDRSVRTLSGGEAVLVSVAARFLARPDVLLLDEPTNDLDLGHRHRLYEAVEGYRGVLVAVSHDRELLERMDRIVELRDGTARVFGGNFGAYREMLAREQEAAAQAVRSADADVRRQRREQVQAQTKLARRARTGRKQEAESRFPKVVAHERKRQAQVSAGKLRETHDQRLAEAEARLAAARDAVRDPEEARIDLPGTSVPSRRVVLACAGLNVDLPVHAGTLWAHDIDLTVQGAERVALLGPNGGGKSTLLHCVAGQISPSRGTVEVGVDRVGYLPQRLDILDPGLSVLENVRRAAPGTDPQDLRARLARFAFRGDLVDQPAATLSGGEWFRAALAGVLSAEPPPQLLLLDEPTNNLDLHTVAQLQQALDGYDGALLLASHDLPFLHAVGIDRWLHVSRRQGLTVTGAAPTALGSGAAGVTF